MDFTALLALLMTAYEAHKAKKAVGGDDNPDAVIETIMPEVAKYFASLFKGDVDGFFTALNALVLGLYHISGDAFQFFIRLMVNMKAEKLQARYPWMSLPFLIFIKGYFNALEEATKGKPKPSADDIKAATDKVAAEAKKAAGDLKSKFDAAKEAVKGMHIPHSDSPPPSGGPVPHHDPRAGPSGTAPAAGGTGDKKSFEERLSGFFTTASLIWEKVKWAMDRGEDYAQSVAKGLVFVTGLIIATLVLVALATFSENPRLMVLVVVAGSLAWVMGPFAGFLVWRRKARKIEARTPSANPHEQAGNGFAEGGGIMFVNAFVWGVSTIVVAILSAVGAYTHFAWGYVWTGLIAIGVAFFAWILGDFVADGTKALIRAITKDENEGAELKLKNRLARSFSLVGLVYCLAMVYPVLNGVFNHTQYGWGVSLPCLFLALLAGFVNTRTSSPPSVQPAEYVKAKWLGFSASDYESARRLLLWCVVPTIALLLLNTFVPPAPKADGKLPSYSERITAFVKKDAVNSATGLRNEVVGLVSATEGAATSSCSDEVTSLMERIEKDDCKVALQESTNSDVIRLCKDAVSCGALREDGSKKPVAVRKVGPRDAGFNWWYVGVPTAIALFLVFAWIGRKDPEAGKEKKEGTGPAAH